MLRRVRIALSGVLAVVFGLAPHVLHHAGPLAGAALFAGATGSILFGALGFVAAIPFLLRVHRRRGNWRMPAALLASFAVMFSISTFVIGPALAGSGPDESSTPRTPSGAPASPAQPSGHEAHH